MVPKISREEVAVIPKTRIRPWIQGFSCLWCKDYISYDREKFREQIEAIEAYGGDSWWVWNAASNYYGEWYDDRGEE